MRELILKKKEDLRLAHGHLWIFSNEVASDLGDFAPGEEVLVKNAQGQCLGTACVNPHALICARLHSHKAGVPLDAALFKQRLTAALSLRSALFPKPWYRLCHGEGDFLPGLVIDRYDRHLTVQITTKAMEERKEMLVPVLQELLAPQSLLFANDNPIRALEGLSLAQACLGDVPEELEVPENGCLFRVPCKSGQKTGWFYDQRDNRAKAASMAKDLDVLDAFCYAGGFGVACAKAGCRSVTFLDASTLALDYARTNLEKNVPASAKQAEYLEGAAQEHLAALFEQGQRFDLVSIDPPAFIKRRKDAAQGISAYRRLNLLAARLLRPGGVLVSSSCSYHLKTETLLDCIVRAAHKLGKIPQLLAFGRQAADHPELLGMPETSYLKCCLVRLLPKT
ncbi:MAG: class I SAM-dependent rRNA methyltransferase [Desulfovibrio sp.]|nr:class I SAM-dependent rRNA methyltransferase [Desulfovibrio sp.]